MRRIGRCVNFLTMEFILKMIVAGLLLSQFKLRYIVKNSMTESAKDINSIYSSYNLTQYTYIETTETKGNLPQVPFRGYYSSRECTKKSFKISR